MRVVSCAVAVSLIIASGSGAYAAPKGKNATSAPAAKRPVKPKPATATETTGKAVSKPAPASETTGKAVSKPAAKPGVTPEDLELLEAPDSLAPAESPPPRATTAAFVPASSEPIERDVVSDAPPASLTNDRGVTRALLVVEPTVGVGSRNFHFVDRLTNGLRPYSVGAAARVGVAGELYPLAGSRTDLWSGVGVAVSYAASPMLRSEDATGNVVDTGWTSFDAALKMRVPLGSASAVYGTLGYGLLDFGFNQRADTLRTTPASQTLPEVGYRFVRTGLEGRVAFWKMAAFGGFDYLAVTDTGAMGERFPRSSAGGIEAHVGLAYRLPRWFEIRTGLHYQRFFFDLQPEVGDANVAGGALDQYGRWDTSLAFAY